MSKVELFPFWMLVGLLLHVVGKIVSAMIPKPLELAVASRYLRIATIGLMIAQIYGYRPFTLI